MSTINSNIFELYKQAYGEEALDALVKEAEESLKEMIAKADPNVWNYEINKRVVAEDPHYSLKRTGVSHPILGASMGASTGAMLGLLTGDSIPKSMLRGSALGAGVGLATGVGLGEYLDVRRKHMVNEETLKREKQAYQEDFDMFKTAFGQNALNDLINEVAGDMKKQASEAIKKEALWFQNPEQKQKMNQILDYTGDLEYDFEDKQYNNKEQFDALQRLQQDAFYKELDDISARGMHEADPNHNKKTYGEVGTIGGGLAGAGIGAALAEKGWKPKAIGGARGAFIGANAGALLGLGKGIVEDIREKRKYSVPKEASEALEMYKAAFGEDALDALIREAADEISNTSSNTEAQVNQSDTDSNDGTTMYNTNSETGAFIDKMRKNVK